MDDMLVANEPGSSNMCIIHQLDVKCEIYCDILMLYWIFDLEYMNRISVKMVFGSITIKHYSI